MPRFISFHFLYRCLLNANNLNQAYGLFVPFCILNLFIQQRAKAVSAMLANASAASAKRREAKRSEAEEKQTTFQYHGTKGLIDVVDRETAIDAAYDAWYLDLPSSGAWMNLAKQYTDGTLQPTKRTKCSHIYEPTSPTYEPCAPPSSPTPFTLGSPAASPIPTPIDYEPRSPITHNEVQVLSEFVLLFQPNTDDHHGCVKVNGTIVHLRQEGSSACLCKSLSTLNTVC